jgi:uncharacterized protein (TIGR02444 family)
MTQSADALWSFVKRLYARPGMAPVCLELQDRHHVDVTLLFHLLLLARSNRSVSPAGVAQIEAAAKPWREAVIAPLRRIRRDLKTMPASYPEAPALRQGIAGSEIEAERMQLLFLQNDSTETQPTATPGRAAERSLAAYCTHLGLPADTAAAVAAHFAAFMHNETEG